MAIKIIVLSLLVIIFVNFAFAFYALIKLSSKPNTTIKRFSGCFIFTALILTFALIAFSLGWV